jgi:hypothetical protein
MKPPSVSRPWWCDELRRTELKTKWTPAMEKTVRELVYGEILDGTHADDIVAQGELLEDPAELVLSLKRLRYRLDHWIGQFDPQSRVEDPLRDPSTAAFPRVAESMRPDAPAAGVRL